MKNAYKFLLFASFFFVSLSNAEEPTPLPRVEISRNVQRDFIYHAVEGRATPYSQQSYDNGGGGGEFVDLEVAANRKQPSCDRESKFLAFVRTEAESGHPMSNPYAASGFASRVQGFISDFTDDLSGGVKDPKYSGANWRKKEVAFQYFDVNTGTPVLLIAHYWWNQYTYEVDDLKLKNSKEDGCRGQVTYTG